MKKILILAANPRRDLNLDREIRDLECLIEFSKDRADLQIISEPILRVDDLRDVLAKHQPQIVHFCGHGEMGLMFETAMGREQPLGSKALSNLFRPFADSVECVLLNACYSEDQADSIADHINYVIGMNQAIHDHAATAFSKGFYRALNYGCTMEEAYELGCNAIQLEISGGSGVRSLHPEIERKLKVTDLVTTTAIPAYLQPCIKKNLRLNLEIQASTISAEQRSAIQLEIDTALNIPINRTVRSNSKRWWPMGIASLGILACGFIAFQFVLPEMAQTYAQKGQEKIRVGDYGGAEKEIKRALALDDQLTAPNCLLAEVYEAQHNPAALKAWHNCSIKADIDRPSEKAWAIAAQSKLQAAKNNQTKPNP
jgi:hypothetical protein